MKTNKGERITAAAAGQQSEMSREDKMRKLAAAVEVFETVIERAIRAKFGIPVIG